MNLNINFYNPKTSQLAQISYNLITILKLLYNIKLYNLNKSIENRQVQFDIKFNQYL